MVGDTSDRWAVVSSAYSRNETLGTQEFKSLMKMAPIVSLKERQI